MITNTNKRGRVSGSAPTAGSDVVLAEESLFMFAEQRGRKVLGEKN
ncbi:hypothetical protein [Pontiella agarivorans]|nr:hypothetical protein [Pontiella agarivorans]